LGETASLARNEQKSKMKIRYWLRRISRETKKLSSDGKVTSLSLRAL